MDNRGLRDRSINANTRFYFIGFNPARERAMNEFTKANVPIITGKNLTKIWNIIFSEDFPNDD